jgi:predicted alpha/beta-hydrolase family hydrolase
MKKNRQTSSAVLLSGPEVSKVTVVLAHGAGAFMDTPFMDAFASGFARAGIRTLRFEFPYMQRRRQSGKKFPPDRQSVLIEHWLEIIESLGEPGNLVIGGKSMGGRIASMVAAEAGVRGLICLGYPFHPLGKPENLRVDHLRHLGTPTLILQGSRDPFGGREEIPSYPLSDSISIVYLEDGDHSFKPRKSSGLTTEQNWDEAIEQAVRFVESF